MKLAIFLLISLACFAADKTDLPRKHLAPIAQTELPDAPQPQPVPKFFTFRGSWQDPPLRTNKQVFRAPSFWIPVGGCAAAMITDVQVTHGAREQYHSEAPTVAALAALSYLSHRLIWAPFTVGIGSYCAEHYIRDVWR